MHPTSKYCEMILNNLDIILCFQLYTVTLDYRTLTLLVVKKADEEFVLGGRGVDVEFCFLCDAIRV